MQDRSRLPSVGPVIWYLRPQAAIDWLETAFGFERRLVVEGDAGAVHHSELNIGDGYVMVVGPPRDGAVSPMQFGGRATQSVHVQLRAGLDEHCEQARAAGARILREPETQPYGDRVYTCTDLEDHPWSFGQAVATPSDAEVSQATGHKITVGQA
ncbi:MAG: VOC family protein [Phenylobacterium sp.]